MKDLRKRASVLREQLHGRYVALATRERVLVLATGLALTGFGWDLLLNQRAEGQLAAAERQLDAASGQLNARLGTAAGMRAGGAGKELAALRLAVSRQRGELRDLQSRLQERIAGFVPPDQTERLLEDVLSHHPGMKLESAEVLASEPVRIQPVGRLAGRGDARSAGADPAPNAASGTGTAAQLFRHAMRLELSGSYLDALAYLHELERMPWGLAWDRVDFQVVTHPKGRLVLELHTLSDRKEWVGAQRS